MLLTPWAGNYRPLRYAVKAIPHALRHDCILFNQPCIRVESTAVTSL